MNQFANYLQYHTQRVIPVYQNNNGSRSPSFRTELPFNTSCSPNNSKYIKQFKCLDQTRNQNKPNTFPIHKQSPNNKAPQITTKLRILDKENCSKVSNMNYISTQPCVTPRQGLRKVMSYNSSNIKQPTPQFENKNDFEGVNQEFLLSNYEMNIRFVDSENHSRDEQQLLTIAEQLNRIDIKTKVDSQHSPKSIKSDEFLVQMDSVKKQNLSQTKTIGIQAFESTQFDKSEQYLEKIFGSSFKKVKIIRKKQSQPTQQTQYTQKTTEDESIFKIDTQQDQPLKTIHNLSNIDFQIEQLQTQNSDLDSHRQRSHEEHEYNSFRSNVVTPRQQHQKKISNQQVYERFFNVQKVERETN